MTKSINEIGSADSKKRKERDLDSSVCVSPYALRSLRSGSSGEDKSGGGGLDADMEKLIEAREKARVKARARAKASTEKKKVVVEKKKRKIKEEEKVSDSDNNDQEFEGEEDEEDEEDEEEEEEGKGKEYDEGGNGDAEGNEVEMAEVGEVCQTGGMDSEEMEIEKEEWIRRPDQILF